MNKKLIGISSVLMTFLLFVGMSSAQLTTYYPASSNSYTQSLSNGVFQNTEYTIGQASNATTLLVPLLEIFFILIFFIAIWVKVIEPMLRGGR
jgi:hypothetical protein